MNLDILHRILSVDVPEDTVADWSLCFQRSTTFTATGTLTSKDIFNVDETGSRPTFTRVGETGASCYNFHSNSIFHTNMQAQDLFWT